MNYRLYINNDRGSIIFYYKNHALLWKSLNFNFSCSWTDAHPLVVSYYKQYDNLNVVDSKKHLVSDTKKIVAMQILLSLVLL